jgi:uncharacterized membrane protein YhaH (DUF805 family)
MLYWIVNPWRCALDFRGRTTRREYWLFMVQLWLAFAIAAIGSAGFVDTWRPDVSDLELGWVIIGFFVAALIPYASSSVRRIHDHGKSGWLFLLTLVPVVGWILWLIMMLTPGTPGENGYGPDPRERGRLGARVASIFS